MAIIHEHAIMRAESGEDLQECEGCAVKKNAEGKLVLATAADKAPLGIVHVGGDQGEQTDYILPAWSGIAGVKLAADPGTVAEGTRLVVSSSGTFKALPATAGAYTVMATACEPGEASQLLEATLMAPTVVTVP